MALRQLVVIAPEHVVGGDGGSRPLMRPTDEAAIVRGAMLETISFFTAAQSPFYLFKKQIRN